MSRFRILMYSSYFPPEYSGAALQAIALSRHLRDLGHHIEFVTQRWPGLAADDEVEGFRVRRLEPGRGAKHRELRLWWNLYRFLQERRGEFDFLHSHGAYYKDAIVGPFARHFGMRSVVKASLADNDLRDLGLSISGRIHRAMLRRVDTCVAISRDLEAEFARGGIAAEQVRYMPNGVDVERFRPAGAQERRDLREKLGLPRDRKLVLYVGVFDERKNIGWLIREWLAAGGFGLDAVLVAIGPQSRDDPDGRFKRGLVAEARQHSEILLIGDKADHVADYYRAADAFVMPSLCEGMPNAVLEAMSCGLPCVAANVSGTRELVDNGVTGFLFDNGAVDTLRDGLATALGDQGASLGAAARARVERDFALGRLARRYQDLYAELLG